MDLVHPVQISPAKFSPSALSASAAKMQCKSGQMEKAVQGTRHTHASLLKDVSVNHGGGDIAAAQQGLDGGDVCAVLRQVGGQTMPEGAGADLFGQSCPAYRRVDRLIDAAASLGGLGPGI
jgi:hypothetical protein